MTSAQVVKTSQSPTTVLFRKTLARTITTYELIFGSSNLQLATHPHQANQAISALHFLIKPATNVFVREKLITQVEKREIWNQNLKRLGNNVARQVESFFVSRISLPITTERRKVRAKKPWTNILPIGSQASLLMRDLLHD